MAQQNVLITGEPATTQANLAHFLSMVCAASSDEDACDPGLRLALIQATKAAEWLVQNSESDQKNSAK